MNSDCTYFSENVAGLISDFSSLFYINYISHLKSTKLCAAGIHASIQRLNRHNKYLEKNKEIYILSF